MRTFYKFELISTNVPEEQKGEVKKDSKVGGIKNTYKIFKISCIDIFGKQINVHKKYMGKQSFLRPYKSIWNKRRYRVPKVYWGNDPQLMNLWIALCNDYDKLPKTLLSHKTTQLETIELFGVIFESKILKKSLKTNKTFNY